MYVIVFYCFYVVIDVFLCYCAALVAYSINNSRTVAEEEDRPDPEVSQSVSALDRPRVVAPSKTCGHVRSSRRRWR